MTKPITINPAILSIGSMVEVDLRLPNNNRAAYLFGSAGNRLDPRNRGVDYMAMIRRLKGDICDVGGKKKQGCGCKK